MAALRVAIKYVQTHPVLMSASVSKASIVNRVKIPCCYAKVKSFTVTVAVIVLMVIVIQMEMENWQILMSVLMVTVIMETALSSAIIQKDLSIVIVKVDMFWTLLMDQLAMVCMLGLSQLIEYE